MTAPAPWAAADEASRKQHRRKEAAEQWQHIGHLRPSQLKEKLVAIVIPAESELASIDKTIVDYNAKIDAAVARHADATTPLQAKLENEATPTAKRIELRAAVNAANAAIEVEIESLKKFIDAANTERDYYRSLASGRQAIEAAYAKNAATPKEKLREAVLRKVCEGLDLIQFGLSKSGDPAADMACAELSKYKHMASSEIDANRRRHIAELYS